MISLNVTLTDLNNLHLLLLSPPAPEQPSGSTGCGTQTVSQLPGVPLCLQWHWSVWHLLCRWQTQHRRHDALVSERLVSIHCLLYSQGALNTKCNILYWLWEHLSSALRLLQDEPVHHSDRERCNQRQECSEGQSDWTAQWYLLMKTLINIHINANTVQKL